jgi:hypothetical protein
MKKKTINVSRLDRTVGTGVWKGEDTGAKMKVLGLSYIGCGRGWWSVYKCEG